MKKIIVVPDSFKSSLRSTEICEIAAAEIKSMFPDCRVVTLPVADGGEGTVDCFLAAMSGTEQRMTVQGPYREEIPARYARFGDTAVVEMASAAGLPLVGERRSPGKTTTYGVGQLLRHAVEHGATNLVLGLGGSATNDAGCGCAAAMGVVFTDQSGNRFLPVGETLSQIANIDVSAAQRLMKGCRLTVMCDIDNPMHGKTGAAYVFGPQKGASPEEVAKLDFGLKKLDAVIQSSLGLQAADIPGAGAAGAFGAGAVAFLGGELHPGIETVLDTVGFDHHLDGADLVITGEGKTDSQSMRGKVISGVAKRAKRKGVPVIVLSGVIDDDAGEGYRLGITSMFSISRMAIPFPESCDRAAEDYRQTLHEILATIAAFKTPYRGKTYRTRYAARSHRSVGSCNHPAIHG